MTPLSLHVADVLCCPACRAKLAIKQDALWCANVDCPLSKAPFAEIEGKPVLIDPQASLFDVAAVAAMTEASRRQRRALRTGWPFRFADSVYRWLLPISAASERNAETLRRLLPPEGSRLLVIGGGTRGEGTRVLWSDARIQWIAFDVYASPNVDFVADAHRLPISDGTFDAVWIQAVLEHVVDPWKVVGEIHRVLKPDGLVYAETPFMQQVHEGAYDFFRFSHSAHRLLFKDFGEVESGAVAGAGAVVIWSIRYFVRSVTGSDMAGRIASLLFFWCLWLDKVGSRRNRLDAASCLFFLGRKSSMPMRPEMLAAYYETQRSPPTA